MLRTIAYLRKSSEDETEKQANSIERQRKDIEKYIEDYNNTVDADNMLYITDKDYITEDRSAKKLWREKFSKMMDKIEKWRYQVLLCTELSRLSRNPIDTWRIVNSLDDDKLICIRTLSNVFYNNPTDKFTFSLFLAVAKYENDQRWKNTSSGMNYKKSQWWTTHLAPLWYINMWNKKWERYVDIDWVNFYNLQELWKLFATWKYNVAEIHRIWNNQWITRIKNYKWDKWTPTRVIPCVNTYRSMFSNSYYCWILVNDWVEIEWKHQAMVNRELFDKVQLVLQKTGFKHSPVKDFNYENILSEILVCGKSWETVYVDVKTRYTCPICKTRYSAKKIDLCKNCWQKYHEQWKKEVRKYYIFPKWFEHTYIYKWITKTTRSIPSDYIENIVDEELNKLYISEWLFNILKRIMYTIWLEENQKIEKDKSKLSKEKKDKEKKRNMIINKIYSDDNIPERDIEILRNNIKDLDLEVEELEDDISELSQKIDENFDKVWEWLNILLQTKKIFSDNSNKSLEPKRKLLLSICSNQKFLNWKITFEWKKPFDKLYSNETIKQKSQNISEINESSSSWLPE